jgi:hypothetical protein
MPTIILNPNCNKATDSIFFFKKNKISFIISQSESDLFKIICNEQKKGDNILLSAAEMGQ